MAVIGEIYTYIDQIAPFELQMDFDNAGFLVGREDTAVHRLLVSLDITQSVVEEAVNKECQLIVSHHPIIFHPVKSVTNRTVTGCILMSLIENKIGAICAHTNLDAVQGGVSDCLAKSLGLSQITLLHQEGKDSRGKPFGIGRVGMVHRRDLSVQDYAHYVKCCLGAESVRCTDGGKPVQKVAVGGGACGSMLQAAADIGCDTFVTADVKYDQFLEAKALGVSLLDAGHYATENVVCPILAQALQEKFTDIEVVLSANHREIYVGI